MLQVLEQNMVEVILLIQRREINEMIKKRLKKVFLYFFLRITNDKMFQIFKDLYEEKKPNNTLFQIIDNIVDFSFSDEIIKYNSKIYHKQRQNGEEGCLLNNITTIEIL